MANPTFSQRALRYFSGCMLDFKFSVIYFESMNFQIFSCFLAGVALRGTWRIMTRSIGTLADKAEKEGVICLADG